MNDRWRTSREMLARAQDSLAGGVSSPFRRHFPVPLYFRDGCGSKLVDVDGNEYIDYTLAWGPLVLGHRHPAIVDAMRRAAESPHLYGAQHALEIEVAEKVQRAIPCAERVIFTSSGSEAVQLALRLARAATGRTIVLKFEGHYHGWIDSVLLHYRAPLDRPGSAGQVPNAAANIIAAPWNDRAAVEGIFAERGSGIAAIICEPVLCNSGCLMPEPGFLKFLRETATRHGALLIFDEIITGFRMRRGSAQAHFGVTPDLATLGKALGGGLPLSAVAGKAEILGLMQTGGVVFGGTFNGNPVSLAAGNAALGELMRDNWAALDRANTLGEQLMRRLSALPLEVTGFGAAMALHFTAAGPPRNYRDTLNDDRDRLTRAVRAALEEGIYLLPDSRLYVSAVHSEDDIVHTVEAASRWAT